MNTLPCPHVAGRFPMLGQRCTTCCRLQYIEQRLAELLADQKMFSAPAPTWRQELQTLLRAKP